MMNGASLDILQDRLAKLKKDYPEIFTEGKIDFEKFKASFSEEINFANERYVLNWAGKSDAFKTLQIPTTATLIPQEEESINFDTSENVFIEGENLEVLKVLQKSYYGKVKCIIIDPPYNTGNDSFIYPDSFKENKEDYQKRVGDKDEEGYLTKEGFFKKNSKDSGHYHSNWLSMMYPRLFLAKNLLREDGVIFAHIDDNEVHNLRILMNEIFGEENFIEQIIWKNKYNAGALSKGFSNIHEYILAFSKNPIGNIEAELDDESIKKYSKQDDKFSIRGGYVTQPLATGSKDERPNLRYPINYNGLEIWPEKQWIWSKERVENAIKNDEVVFNKAGDTYNPRVKQYLKDEYGIMRKGKPISILIGPYNQEGSKEIKQLFNKQIFDFPKPSSLIKYLASFIINENNEKGGIYLDFFGGSGTLAQSIFELNKDDGGNRKFILVQLPELCDENSEAFKAGYPTIADISKERIRRVIQKIKDEKKAIDAKKATELNFKDKIEESTLDLGFKCFKLSDSNFKIWRGEQINARNLENQLGMFINPVQKDEPLAMMYELVLKSGYLLTDRIERVQPLMDQEVGFFSVKGGEFILLLEEINEALILAILSAAPHKLQKVIALDSLFKDNDQLKTNTVLQMRDAGVEFKTV